MSKKILISLLIVLSCNNAIAHRSGCHRWHSCPSDSGSYVCGDLGYCSGCPDNQFCKSGKPALPEIMLESTTQKKEKESDEKIKLGTGPTQPGPANQCHQYLKYGLPSQKGALLCRIGYALIHNPERKTPDWVIEYLTREKAQASLERSDKFLPDPDLLADQRAELIDYKGSGYDRGHMAPAADMRWSKQAMNESFFLSNMAPQVGAGMNQGIWKDLEEKVRSWAINRGELFIFTGPVYKGSPITIGRNRVAVPTGFYKIAYDPIRSEAIAFYMPNKKLNTKDMPDYIVPIDQIEQDTSLDFLSTLNDQIEFQLESKKAVRIWE